MIYLPRGRLRPYPKLHLELATTGRQHFINLLSRFVGHVGVEGTKGLCLIELWYWEKEAALLWSDDAKQDDWIRKCCLTGTSAKTMSSCEITLKDWMSISIDSWERVRAKRRDLRSNKRRRLDYGCQEYGLRTGQYLLFICVLKSGVYYVIAFGAGIWSYVTISCPSLLTRLHSV